MSEYVNCKRRDGEGARMRKLVITSNLMAELLREQLNEIQQFDLTGEASQRHRELLALHESVLAELRAG